jgi:hypothetical protein
MRKKTSSFQTGQRLIFICIFAVGAVGALSAVVPTAGPQGTRNHGDYISPGFFSAPAGIRPANALQPSHFPHARRSYAWRIHDGKRELITFSTPIQHVVII